MKVTGIIAEYNPFHNGHLHHLQEAKRLTGCDYLVIVLSGDFVQRGVPALTDKFSRAQMALACGADLVLELPAPYASGSAEYFAGGAVSLLEQLGVVDFLCFGSECGDLEMLGRAAKVLAEEPPAFRSALQEYLKSGYPFPAAREKAFLDVCGRDSADAASGLLSRPNNLLALEYLKALYQSGSKMQPVTVPRVDNYHETAVLDGFCSATSIRCALQGGGSVRELAACLPEAVVPILDEALAQKPQPSLDDYSDIFHYLLVKARSARELAVYLDVTPELANRMFALRGQFGKLTDFAHLVNGKQITYARILRCFAHMLLDIQTADVERRRVQGWHSYARILGFRKDSTALLSAIKKRSALPLVTKLADAPVKLSEEAWEALQTDLFASSVYHLTDPVREGQKPWAEFSREIVRM